MSSTNLSAYNKEDIVSAKGMSFGIVVSKWNQEVTNGLYEGCVKALLDLGVIEKNINKKEVPGSYELPLGAQFFLEYTDVNAVICLGSVIQGETKHFDFVCEAVAQGIKDVMLKYNKPVIFGVLTDNTMEQSLARSGGEKGNKGVEAAVTAVQMAALQETFTI